MALVATFFGVLAREYEAASAAKQHNADPKDRGGRELAMARTTREVGDAFSRLDTHHEAVLAGLQFLSSQAGLNRVLLFAPESLRGGATGRSKTCGDMYAALSRIIEQRRVRTFAKIPGVLTQAAVAWGLVAQWAETQVAAGEAECARRTAALPPASAESKAQELAAARAVLAGLSATGPGSQLYPAQLAEVARLQAEFDVLRSGGTLLGQASNPAVEAERAAIAAKLAALGREKSIAATWTREAQVLREAARLGFDPAGLHYDTAVQRCWLHGPVALLNTTVLTEPGDYTSRVLSLDEAKAIIRYGTVSYVGHAGTAQAMSAVLGVPVEDCSKMVPRPMFSHLVGQHALCFKLNGRLAEGQILSLEEVRQVGFDFRVITRIA